MRRLTAIFCLPLSALLVAGCGNTVSTSGFKGEAQAVAKAVANLQSYATGGEEKKICGEVLAAAVVSRLGGAAGCQTAIKNQLAEVDNLEVTVDSVDVASGASTATASVTSVHEGKKRPSTVSLVKEGGKWKVSALS